MERPQLSQPLKPLTVCAPKDWRCGECGGQLAAETVGMFAGKRWVHTCGVPATGRQKDPVTPHWNDRSPNGIRQLDSQALEEMSPSEATYMLGQHPMIIDSEGVWLQDGEGGRWQVPSNGSYTTEGGWKFKEPE